LVTDILNDRHEKYLFFYRLFKTGRHKKLIFFMLIILNNRHKNNTGHVRWLASIMRLVGETENLNELHEIIVLWAQNILVESRAATGFYCSSFLSTRKKSFFTGQLSLQSNHPLSLSCSCSKALSPPRRGDDDDMVSLSDIQRRGLHLASTRRQQRQWVEPESGSDGPRSRLDIFLKNWFLVWLRYYFKNIDFWCGFT
jgi:hypothetical protein